ncbi:hypothetical protein RJZ90_005304 [Blastomyces dermatitidis]
MARTRGEKFDGMRLLRKPLIPREKQGPYFSPTRSPAPSPPHILTLLTFNVGIVDAMITGHFLEGFSGLLARE